MGHYELIQTIMANEENQNDQKQQADAVQSQINDLQSKAEHSAGDEKQGIMAKISELNAKKDSILSEVQSYETKAQNLEGDAKKFMGDAGI